MFNKVATKSGLGITNTNLKPCPYQIMTSMGGFERTKGLIK
jgi:hypothetical protein